MITLYTRDSTLKPFLFPVVPGLNEEFITTTAGTHKVKWGFLDDTPKVVYLFVSGHVKDVDELEKSFEDYKSLIYALSKLKIPNALVVVGSSSFEVPTIFKKTLVFHLRDGIYDDLKKFGKGNGIIQALITNPNLHMYNQTFLFLAHCGSTITTELEKPGFCNLLYSLKIGKDFRTEYDNLQRKPVSQSNELKESQTLVEKLRAEIETLSSQNADLIKKVNTLESQFQIEHSRAESAELKLQVIQSTTKSLVDRVNSRLQTAEDFEADSSDEDCDGTNIVDLTNVPVKVVEPVELSKAPETEVKRNLSNFSDPCHVPESNCTPVEPVEKPASEQSGTLDKIAKDLLASNKKFNEIQDLYLELEKALNSCNILVDLLPTAIKYFELQEWKHPNLDSIVDIYALSWIMSSTQTTYIEKSMGMISTCTWVKSSLIPKITSDPKKLTPYTVYYYFVRTMYGN